jgi:hypothetical protein
LLTVDRSPIGYDAVYSIPSFSVVYDLNVVNEFNGLNDFNDFNVFIVFSLFPQAQRSSSEALLEAFRPLLTPARQSSLECTECTEEIRQD